MTTELDEEAMWEAAQREWQEKQASLPPQPLKMPSAGGSSPRRFEAVKCECIACEDRGYEEIEIALRIFDAVVIAPVKRRRPCPARGCKAVAQALATWHSEVCECEFGWLEVTPNRLRAWERFTEACPNCEEGRENKVTLARFEAQQRQEILNRRVGNSGLSESQLAQTFESFLEITPRIAQAKATVLTRLEGGRNILIAGPTGTGKTHLAVACLNRALAGGKAGIFTSLSSLMGTLRSTMDSEYTGPGWDTLLNRYIQSPLLVLDDLGQEKGSEKVNETLFRLLNDRINAGLPTIATTNFNADALMDKVGYSQAIVSRLSHFEVIRLTGEDRRLKR